MLDVTPTNLKREVDAAVSFRNHHMEAAAKLRNKLGGREHDATNPEASDLENHAYEFISLVLPSLIMDNPQVRLSHLIDALADAARILQYQGNRWSRETKFREPLIAVGVDTAFAFGAMMVGREPVLGHDPSEASSPLRPRAYRVPPSMFGFDPMCSQFGEARYVFHQWQRDKEDLLAEARLGGRGWRAGEIEALAEQERPSKSWAGVGWDGRSRERATPARRELTAYDIWVPEFELDAATAVGGRDVGLNGTIFTISDDKEIREPRPFFGPSYGPYTLFGFYTVPDDPIPLSPLVATASQSAELNLVAKAISAAARDYKKVMLVDSVHSQLGDDLVSKAHHSVIPVEGLDSSAAVPAEVGGITTQLLEQEAQMRARLDRNSGMDDARRGSTPPGVSATASDIAERSGAQRLAFMQRQFTSSVQRVFETVLWYLSVEAGLVTPPMFDQIDVTIDPISLSRPSEAIMQQRATLGAQVVLQVAPLVPQMPWVDWRTFLNGVGDAYGLPMLADIVRPEIALDAMAAGAPNPDVQRRQSGRIQIPRLPGRRPLPGLQRGVERTADATRGRRGGPGARGGEIRR